MGNVNDAGIWTPDEGDNLDPEVWSGTMADSIMNGIGERLNKQEARGGLKARTAALTIGVDNEVVPVVIGTTGYINGMTLAGGYVTADVAGLYIITGRATSNVSENLPVDANLWLNGENVETQSFAATPTSFSTTLMVTPLFLEVGDIFHMTLGVGGGYTEPTTVDISNTALTATMIYAV